MLFNGTSSRCFSQTPNVCQPIKPVLRQNFKADYTNLRETMTQGSETLFAKIIRREIPADIVYEDELALAFRDIHPQAPVHILVIPKQPLPKLADAQMEDQALLGHLLLTVKAIAAQEGLANGYRVVINTGDEGGQTVNHLHLHILGGRAMKWPPG
jgi:histidine triad (HIT) family protein